jgi:hypothetical protein
MEFTSLQSESFKQICKFNNLSFRSQPFQIDSSHDLTVNFFKDIYAYPPKINVKFTKLDDFNNLTKANKIIFDKGTSKSDSMNGNDSSYSNSLLNKNFTSKFYSARTRKLEKLLEVIPVYVILNGQRELIISSAQSNSFLETISPKDIISRKIQKVCEISNSSQRTIPSNLGFGFMNYKDAEAYLADVLNQWDSNSSTVGVSLHCVSLSSVYKLMRTKPVHFDFRLIPNMGELTLLLNKHIGNSNLVFNPLQYQVRRRVRPLSFTPRVKNFYLGSQATPFYKFVSNNEYFKGVPIYIVQVLNGQRNLLLEGSLNATSTCDNIAGKVLNVLQTFVGYGQIQTLQTPSKVLEKSNGAVDYIFFNYQQANNFVKKHSRSVVRHNGSSFYGFGWLSKKSRIYVTNLEDLLESSDISSLQELHNLDKPENAILTSMDKIFDRETYFIPDEASLQSFDNVILKSSITGYKENLLIKYKLLKSAIATLFEF